MRAAKRQTEEIRRRKAYGALANSRELRDAIIDVLDSFRHHESQIIELAAERKTDEAADMASRVEGGKEAIRKLCHKLQIKPKVEV